MSSLLLHLALSATVACGARDLPMTDVSPADTAGVVSAAAGRTIVEVDNRNYNDATIYVVQGVRSMRLGRVSGLTKAEFVLPAHLVVGVQNVRFVVRPFPTRRASVSHDVMVSAGDVIGLVIPPY